MEKNVENNNKSKKLWKFDHTLAYAQCIGVFAATDEEVESVIGKEVCFGEIEGKHSEVCEVLERDDFEVLSEDPAIVNDKNFRFGYNPIRYYEEMFE